MRTPRVLQLAEPLEREILDSALTVGAACPSMVQAPRKFRVNNQTANDAPRILAKRGILVQRQTLCVL